MWPEIRNLVDTIENSYHELLHLSANENILSPAARRMLASDLSDRYSMTNRNGSPVATFGQNAAYKSLTEMDGLYDKACAAVNSMLGASHTTLRCLTGAHAMESVLLSITKPGDTVMTVPSKQGGHFCTTGILDVSGRYHVETAYDFDKITFDAAEIGRICKQQNVKVIYLDTSVYINPHPIREIREAIGDDVLIVYDASHTLGLIMGGEFQSPLEEGADIISANSHKTFPGPHKAIVAFNDEALGKQVEATILKNFVSSTQTNVLLSLIVTIFEMQEFGSAYAKAIILNANTLGKTLEECGLHVRHADADTYTHTHQLHVFTPFNREETVRRFLTNNISLGTSGALGTKLFIRLGVQEITRRGYDEADVVKLGKLMADVFKGKNAQKGIAGLLAAHPSVKYGYEL